MGRLTKEQKDQIKKTKKELEQSNYYNEPPINSGFNIFEFTYKDKKKKMRCSINAREEKTAQEIIDIINSNNPLFYFVKKKLFFKRPYITTIAPYELEQEQIENARKQHDHRIKYIKEKENNDTSKK
jgi:hypothetical protein